MEADRRAEVWAKTGGRCWYCGTQTSPWKDFHVEHSIPRSKGGTDNLENLVPSCQPCNNRKRDKGIEEFRMYLQEKAEHRFWFEHARLPMVAVHPTIEEEEDEEPKEFPDAEDWQHFLTWCFRVKRFGPEFILTTLALLQYPMEWVWNHEDAGTFCRGHFTLDWLAWHTCQSLTLLLSHVLWLHRNNFLTLEYEPDGELRYTFFIELYIDTWRLVEKALQKRQ